MFKYICDFCHEEMDAFPQFKVVRTDMDDRFARDMTGFHKKDICISCLRLLKEGSADNE